MGVGGQRHVPAALPSVKTRYPLYRRLSGPQAGLDSCGKFRPRRDSIPGPSCSYPIQGHWSKRLCFIFKSRYEIRGVSITQLDQITLFVRALYRLQSNFHGHLHTHTHTHTSIRTCPPQPLKFFLKQFCDCAVINCAVFSLNLTKINRFRSQFCSVSR